MITPPAQPLSAKSIYFAALELSDPAERSEYLDRACRGESKLREEVQQLLQEHNPDRSNLLSKAVRQLVPHTEGERPVAAERPTPDISSHLSKRHPVIDRYKILEEIGRGGMGTVYMAQQLEPVKRRVALKVINPGMDSREVIARFEAERQALAMMDHPNIARVLDAGTTPEGRPYFVMEVVRGLPITEHCERRRLGLGERLQLFIDVCQAVQHAHQKGIIHRDLKPSNIIVSNHDGTPVVKVIDFGVAKALHQDLTDKTLYTQFTWLIGTPLYMSPEQAQLSDLDIDTRSDIYSLGVLLYELLTGSTPFDRETLATAGIDAARRIITEQVPPRPSSRLSSKQSRKAASDRSFPEDPQKLALQLRDELDWVVMRALEKDRRRRYESATAMAIDIQRYLKNEPVEARPPSSFYLLRKFAARNRSLVGILLAVLTGLLVSIVSLGWSVAEVTKERNFTAAALSEKTAALEASDRHINLLLNVIDRSLEIGGVATRQGVPPQEDVQYQLLIDAMKVYENLLAENPQKIRIQELTSLTKWDMGDDVYDSPLAYREGLIRIADRLLEFKPEVGWIWKRRGVLHFSLGEYEAALHDLRRAVELRDFQALCWIPANRFSNSPLQFRSGMGELAELAEQMVQSKPQDSWLRHDLARALIASSDTSFRDPTRAVALARQCIEDSPGSWEYQHTLGSALRASGKFDEAREVLEAAIHCPGGDTPWNYLSLSIVLISLDRGQEARSCFEMAKAQLGNLRIQDLVLYRIYLEAKQLIDATEQPPTSFRGE